MPQPLMSLADVANYLDVAPSTLYDWRLRRIGPPAIKVGRHLRYRQADVDRWLDKQQQRSA